MDDDEITKLFIKLDVNKDGVVKNFTPP